MADTSTSIAGDVTIESDARARVAYDLMSKISSWEEVDRAAPRKYWMTLYAQCLNLAYGSNPPERLEERPKR